MVPLGKFFLACKPEDQAGHGGMYPRAERHRRQIPGVHCPAWLNQETVSTPSKNNNNKVEMIEEDTQCQPWASTCM